MADKICPKCNKKSEDITVCQHCGIHFDEYETAKQEKFIEIRVLLSENKFLEAKKLAEKLPSMFPDNKVEFLLLLSNINRDISIVKKYELALREYEEEDYIQTSFILRNIKAFDGNLNEKVISLRRKAERYIQNNERFKKAVKEFEKGNYSDAYSLFKEIDKSTHQEKVPGYLHRIDDMKNDILDNAITSLKRNKIEVAGEQFQIIEAIFPEMRPEIEGYVQLLNQRVEIKNNLFAAARKAENEKRLLDAKVLYSFAGTQFPELMPQVLPHLEGIGSEAIISLVDLHESGIVDLEALGLEVDDNNPVSFVSQASGIDDDIVADVTTPDTNEEGKENITRSEKDHGCAVDPVINQLVINEEGVADFVL